jgi:tetratricopeptide (TPR) repeat protein
MTRYFSILPILVLTIFGSCRRLNPDFTSLEENLRTAPDSVLCVLSSMDTDHFNRRDAAYHALLITAEMDLNDLMPTNDSLIDLAVSFFSDRKDIHHKTMSYYYKGIVKKNKGQFQDAIVNFEKAVSWAQKENDLLYSGLSYRNMAHIYTENYETYDAEKMILKAISSFEEAHLPEYVESGRLEYAEILQQSNKETQADSVFKILFRNSAEYPLINYAYQSYAYLLDIKNADDAKKVLETFEKGNKYGFSSGAYSRMAYACSFVYPSLVDSLFQESYSHATNASDTARILFHKSLVAENKGDYKDALTLYKGDIHIQDSIIRIQLQQSLISSLNDVYRREGEIARLRTKNTRLITVSISGLSLLIMLLLCGQLAYSRRKRKELLENISETKRILQEREDDNLRLVKTMMLSKISVIEEAAQMYEEAKNTRKEEEAYKELKTRINRLRSDQNLYREIETALDTYHHGIISKVRQDFPDLTDYMFQLMLLFFAHIPQSTISLLRKSSESSIKTAKYRLRKLFRESGSPRKNDYLYLLDS